MFKTIEKIKLRMAFGCGHNLRTIWVDLDNMIHIGCEKFTKEKAIEQIENYLED